MKQSPPNPLETPRDRILDAASSEFATLGFAGARVDTIAEEAGVNKAMLYYYVGDKKALYTAVMLRNFDRISEHLMGAQEDGGDPRDRFKRTIEAINGAFEANPDHASMMLRELASGAVNLGDEILARVLELVGVIRGLLDDGRACGAFRETEPLLTHIAIVGAILFLNSVAPLRERVAAMAADEFDIHEPPDIGTFVADLVLNGLSSRHSDGEPQ